MTSKVIISAALTGVLANREQCPYIPYTPDEIGEEARRAYEAGAAIVHIHAREDDGSPSFRPERYQEIVAAVKARCPVIINLSTGAVGLTKEERVAHIPVCRPEIAALNMGSMNYAIYSERRKRFLYDFVFQNAFYDIGHFVSVMRENGVRPELECFDRGHIANVAPLVDQGALEEPLQFSLIMGVLGGIPATVTDLINQAAAVPEGSFWQVVGIGQAQWAMVAAGLAMGGHVRVGLEDNFYLAPGEMATSNGGLVAKAARMARDVGREPASVSEARALLRLA
ncbi:MAG TPA: 3-keto-5-aminohexanoate cleavage protein [Symbiobacteriaceae bacterium]|nr:3-keto-5-aminohexanoate cleavage protein [Symbiobacteriaceae bacterium]